MNLSRLFHCSVIKVLHCCLATAFIYYHAATILSTPFFNYFSYLLFRVDCPLTALIYYHFSALPVNTFSHLFIVFQSFLQRSWEKHHKQPKYDTSKEIKTWKTKKEQVSNWLALFISVSRQWPTLPRKEYAVPSALEDLTSVFGMGTGVTPPPLSPGFLFSCLKKSLSRFSQNYSMYNFQPYFIISICLGQALDILVSVSSMDHSTYTPDLSTRSSFWCLTSL